MLRSSKAQVIAALITMHTARHPRGEQLSGRRTIFSLDWVEEELKELWDWELHEPEGPPDGGE